jgi:hypothetical protein
MKCAFCGNEHPGTICEWQDMPRVCCVLSGDWPGAGSATRARIDKLGEHYVEKLFKMLVKCFPGGYKWTFDCFSDRKQIGAIKCRPIPKGLWNYFAKLYLFSTHTYPVGARVLYFDLDTVLTGSWEKLAKISLEKPVMLRNSIVSLTAPASGVMSWRVTPDTQRIWSDFEPISKSRPPYANPRRPGTWSMPMAKRTDEHWLYDYLMPNGWAAWQDLLPDAFASYKEMMRFKQTPILWDQTKVVYFHGRPRPHEVDAEWNPLYVRI